MGYAPSVFIDAVPFLQQIQEEAERRVGKDLLRFVYDKDFGQSVRTLAVHRDGNRPRTVLLEARLLSQENRFSFAIVGESHHCEYRMRIRSAGFSRSALPSGSLALTETVDTLLSWLTTETSLSDAPALGAEYRQTLGRLAKARRAGRDAAESLVLVEEPLRSEGDSPEFTAGMRKRIAEHFPRDKRGNLALGTTVLLAPRETGQITSRRALWYAAEGPALRRDAQVIRVGWHWRTGEFHSHHWETTPYLWNPDAAAQAKEADGSGILAGKIAQTIKLQDEGRLCETLDLWEIAADSEVIDLLGGIEQQAGAAQAVQEAVRFAALWRFEALVRNERIRLEEWRKAKKGRPRKRIFFRLMTLPHQMVSAKVSLILTECPQTQRPLLFLEGYGSEARLPLVRWQRPVAMDLRCFGLESEPKL